MSIVPLHSYPAALHSAVNDAVWEDITFGYSGTQAFCLRDRSGGLRYLKIAAQNGSGASLEEEARVLEWLHDHPGLSVPHVLYVGADVGQAFLLLSAVPGQMAHDEAFVNDVPHVVRLLAAGLRVIHAVDATSCPFDRTLDIQLRTAWERMERGLVDEDSFDAEHRGCRAQSLYDALLATRPAVSPEDQVFTHGDYCLPNVLIHIDEIGGFIDWGRGGIADRYQDLALCARSLAHNWGSQWVPMLFAEYGIAQVDQAKLAYYRLLDEFH